MKTITVKESSLTHQLTLPDEATLGDAFMQIEYECPVGTTGAVNGKDINFHTDYKAQVLPDGSLVEVAERSRPSMVEIWYDIAKTMIRFVYPRKFDKFDLPDLNRGEFVRMFTYATDRAPAPDKIMIVADQFSTSDQENDIGRAVFILVMLGMPFDMRVVEADPDHYLGYRTAAVPSDTILMRYDLESDFYRVRYIRMPGLNGQALCQTLGELGYPFMLERARVIKEGLEFLPEENTKQQLATEISWIARAAVRMQRDVITTTVKVSSVRICKYPNFFEAWLCQDGTRYFKILEHIDQGECSRLAQAWLAERNKNVPVEYEKEEDSGWKKSALTFHM